MVASGRLRQPLDVNVFTNCFLNSEKEISVLQNKSIAAVVVTIVLGWSQVGASDKEIVVDVESALDVALYFKKIGFYDIDNHPERLKAVPRTRLLRVPRTVKDVWRENVSLRKSVFFRLGLSAVLQVNEKIIALRERLLSLSVNNLSADDRSQEARAEVKRLNKGSESHHITEIHRRFLGGELYVVKFQKNGKTKKNYVYVAGKEVNLYKSPTKLIAMIKDIGTRKNSVFLFFEPSVISGIIALLLIVIIGYLLVRNPNGDIPLTLSAALTTLMGFYFGSMRK